MKVAQPLCCEIAEAVKAQDNFQQKIPNIFDSGDREKALLAMPGLKHVQLPHKRFVNCLHVYNKKTFKVFIEPTPWGGDGFDSKLHKGFVLYKLVSTLLTDCKEVLDVSIRALKAELPSTLETLQTAGTRAS